MDNDLIFGTETSDMAAGADHTQIAAVTTTEQPFDDALPQPLDAAQVVVPQGENVVREPVTPGEVVELPFPADAHFLARIDNGNLAIKVGDVTVILQGYVEAAGQTPPVIEASNGQPLDIATILASTDPNIDIQTAAGPAAGAQGQGADNTGAILQQLGGGAGLGGFEGAGAQDGTDGLGGGTVDQTFTLFRQFGLLTNEAPVANDDTFLAIKDTPLVIALPGVLTNDTDPDGDALSVSAFTQPTHGAVTVNPDGSFTYTPTAGYFGNDAFTYTADDGKGGTSTATVSLYVDALPVFQSGFVGQKFTEDTPDHPADLKWKFTDADDASVPTITVDPSTLPNGVTYDPVAQRLQFDTQGKYDYLAAGESASFTIKFTVTDGHGGSIEQDVNIKINGVNDAPVAVADTILNDAALVPFFFSQWMLTANDTDPDSSTLLVHSVGPFSGTGKEDLVSSLGPVDAAYTVSDGTDISAPGTVHFRHDTDGIAGTVTGTDGNDIIVGNLNAADKLLGGKGDDIINGFGGADEIFGGKGDDTLVFNSAYTAGSQIHGEEDNVATQDGLKGGAAMHGDVLAVADVKIDFSDHASVANIDGIETISMQAKLGGFDAQSLTLGAHSVQDLSDHTIAPGGVFTSEKDAVRIDGDAVDQLYLSISKDGGNWADTGVVANGYHVFAHETTGGDPTTTDAYVMVSATVPAANVHLNQDAP